MSATQSISCPSRGILLTGPNVRNIRTSSSVSQISYLKASCLHASPSCGLRQDNLYPRLVYNALKNERWASVCACVKKGDSMGENEPFPQESLKKATGGFRRELTVQDVLRERMKGTQFGGNGGNGNFFGGGGGGGGSGGPEGEGFKGQFHELLQVILATIGVIFLYTLITSGEELALLARDYIRYLWGAKATSRLSRTMDKWHKIFERITWKGVVREDCL